jgi:fatty-acyl-CoA synthase
MATASPQAGPTIGSVALRALRRYGDRIAFSWDGGNLTYAGAAELIGRFQKVYAERGLRRGQRLVLLTANRAEPWCAAIAAQASGLAISWLHPMGSLEDHIGQIEDLDAAAIVVDSRRHAERGAALAEKTHGAVMFGVGPNEFGEDLLAAAEKAGMSRALDVAGADDIAAINYTGGTTGRPKGAMRRHGSAVMQNLVATLANFELPADPRYLAVAPISHVAGTKLLPTLARGGSIHLLEAFTPDGLLETIARERITFTLLVPTMIYALLDSPSLETTDLSSLELLLYGASPMSPGRLREGLERIGPVFSQLYGQTECYPISVLSKADHSPATPELVGSCGTPVSTCEVALLSADGAVVPSGEAGELCVRGIGVMDMYWRRPDLTAEAFAHGWLHTGDIARADQRGYLYIVDRIKDMIISGGFNVYPREVEDALSSHEAVAMAAVFGTADEKWGEAVNAAVVLRPGARVSAEELLRYVKDKKGAVQTPKVLTIVAGLPMTSVGKIDKKALRAELGGSR